MNDDDILEMFGDPSDSEPDSLKELTRLVAAAKKAQARVEEVEKELKISQKNLRTLLDEMIPSAMQEAGGITSIEVSGTKVVVKPFYSARITEETRVDALEWLRSQGHEGLIKHEFTANLGRGSDASDSLDALLSTSNDLGLAYKVSEGVHPQTLSAFVREQTEKGETIPSNLFNLYIGVTTKLIDAK